MAVSSPIKTVFVHILHKLYRYMSAWKGCQHLWKHDTSKLAESLKDKAPSHAKFEEKLSGYHRAAQRVLDEAREVRSQHTMLVACSPASE